MVDEWARVLDYKPFKRLRLRLRLRQETVSRESVPSGRTGLIYPTCADSEDVAHLV